MDQTKEQLEAMLADYVEGTLTDEQMKQAEAYFEQNPAVRQVANRLMIDSEALRSLPRLPAPIDYSEEVRGQLERDLLLSDPVGKGRRLGGPSAPMAAVAAMLLLGLGVGGAAYWILANRPAPSFDVALRPPAEPATAEAEETGRAGAAASVSTPTVPLAEVDADRPLASRARRPGPTEVTAFQGGGRREFASLILEPGPLPADVQPVVSRATTDAAKRTLVFLVDADEAFIATQAVQNFFASQNVPLRDAERRLLADASADGTLARGGGVGGAMGGAGGGATGGGGPSPTMANTIPPTPVAESVAAAAATREDAANGIATTVGGVAEGPTVLAAGDLDESLAARLQATLAERIGAGRSAAYEVLATEKAYQVELPPDGLFGVKGETNVADTVGRPATVSDDRSNRPAATATTESTQPAQADARPAAEGVGDRLAGPATTAPAGPAARPARIRAGDRLRVTVTDPQPPHERTQYETTVAADGTVALPRLSELAAVNRSTDELGRDVTEEYRRIGTMQDPIVHVETLETVAKKDAPAAPAQEPAGKIRSSYDQMQQISGVPADLQSVQNRQQAQAEGQLGFDARPAPVQVIVVARAKKAQVVTTAPATQPSTHPTE